MIIVNQIDGVRIETIASYEQMLSSDYLVNTGNIQTKFLFDQFFKAEGPSTELLRQERLQLLNITYSIPSLVSEKIAEYTGSPKLPYDIDLMRYIMSYIWGGYSVMKVRLVDGEQEVEYASPDEYIKEGSRERLLTTIFVANDASALNVDKYIFEQIYTPGLIENNLYLIDKTQTDSGLGMKPNNSYSTSHQIEGERVELSSIAATNGLPDAEETGLTVNPIVVVNNTFTTSGRYGASDVSKIKSLISSIEVQLVNIQDQLLKHLQAKLALPTSQLTTDKKGFVDVRALEVIAMEAGDPLPMYLINTNPLIEKSFELIEKFLTQIASILSIPTEFFGLKQSGGAESADAKIIRISSFLKKIETIRTRFDKGLEKIFEIGKQWGLYSDMDEFFAVWEEVFPVSQKQLVDELKIARESQLISHKRAIMKYQNLDEDAAQEELDNILNANTINDAAVVQEEIV